MTVGVLASLIRNELLTLEGAETCPISWANPRSAMMASRQRQALGALMERPDFGSCAVTAAPWISRRQGRARGGPLSGLPSLSRHPHQLGQRKRTRPCHSFFRIVAPLRQAARWSPSAPSDANDTWPGVGLTIKHEGPKCPDCVSGEDRPRHQAIWQCSTPRRSPASSAGSHRVSC